MTTTYINVNLRTGGQSDSNVHAEIVTQMTRAGANHDKCGKLTFVQPIEMIVVSDIDKPNATKTQERLTLPVYCCNRCEYLVVTGGYVQVVKDESGNTTYLCKLFIN